MDIPEKLHFAVVGGDMRSIYLARLLVADGQTVTRYANELATVTDGAPAANDIAAALYGVDCVVLPLPVLDGNGVINAPLSKVRLESDEVLSRVPHSAIVCGGKVPQELHSRADSLGLRLIDYLEREELAVLNAIPTAEGALAIAMEKLPITLHGARCLVIGYGRIGEILVADLRALGCSVTASARKYSDIAWISAAGATAVQTAKIAPLLGDFDLIFNTVPSMVLDAGLLRRVNPDAVIIDLASRPGGVDRNAAAGLGLTVEWALSLPGKVAPLTSGKIIRDTVYNILEQWRCGSE